jgi:single-strand DNA-binding protein
MAGSVNKVILIGNVGQDPEVRHLENGTVVANFSIATSEFYTDKNSGEKKENTEWHDIVAWRGVAEVVEKYVKKGYKVYVEGKLRKRNWQDKEGVTRYTVEIFADQLSILSRPEHNEKKPNSSYQVSPEQTNLSPIDQIIQKNNNENDLPF